MISLKAKRRAAFFANRVSSAHSQRHGKSLTPMNDELSRRHLYFFLLVLGSCFVFWIPLRNLIRFSLTRDYGSHILLIAPISAYLIYVQRREVFSKAQFHFFVGSSLFLGGLILGWMGYVKSHASNDFLSVEI